LVLSPLPSLCSPLFSGTASDRTARTLWVANSQSCCKDA
jgi:hypothetical protein